MGWLYMQSLNGHRGPRQYLDAQLTYDRPDRKSQVLRSALVRVRVYYAAVEYSDAPTLERKIFAAVCLVKYNPRARDGYIFGYKDMDESAGPCECDCPEAILDLLTPTSHPIALEWRARCRAKAAKPTPRAGQIIVFDEPLSFADGRNLDRFLVVADPCSRGRLLFKAPDTGGLCRIPNVRKRAYRLVDPPAD